MTADLEGARFCTQCGRPLQPDHRFCIGCGAPRHGAVTETAAAAQPAGDAPGPGPVEGVTPAPLPGGAGPQRPTRRSAGSRSYLKWLALALAVVLSGAAAGAGLWWYQNRPQLVAVDIGLGLRSDNAVQTDRLEFLTTDIIHASLLVRHPREGRHVVVRWLRGDEEVHAQTVRLPRTQPEFRLAVSLAPDEPLEPGEYRLEAAFEGRGATLDAAFRVDPAPEVEATGLILQSDSDTRYTTDISVLTFRGKLKNLNRFSEIEVVWERDGEELKRDILRPTAAELTYAAEGVPFVYTLDRQGNAHMPPGVYRVYIRDGDRTLGSRATIVYVATRVSDLQVGESVDYSGRAEQTGSAFWRPTDLYASVYIESAPAGTVLSIEWYRNGELYDHLSSHKTLSHDVADEYYYWGITGDGDPLPEGTWEVVVWVDEEKKLSTMFRVF